MRVNRDNNVTLTTLNVNPRVFSVKQFAARAETDLLIYNCMHQTNPVMRMARYAGDAPRDSIYRETVPLRWSGSGVIHMKKVPRCVVSR